MNVDVLPVRVLRRRLVTKQGCWEWQGCRDGDGYGRVGYRGQTIGAHRLVAHLVHGLDLSDRSLVARHSCDNPPCFNPAHIQVGTRSDNLHDALRRGQASMDHLIEMTRAKKAARTHCSNGHEYDEQNTRLSYGNRVCRKCQVVSAMKRQRAAALLPKTPCPECGLPLKQASIRGHVKLKHPRS